ncbi:Cytochrome P450 [Rhypophila sp. PSN 637]
MEPRNPWTLMAKYTRLWYMWQKYRNDFHWTNIKLHRENGEAPWCGRPNHARLLHHRRPKSPQDYIRQRKCREFYVAWNVSSDPQVTNLFAARDQGLHASMRRKVAPMYSMTSLVSYEPYVDHCIELLHSQLDRAASAGSAINLGRWLQFLAFDAVSMITFGERLGFLDEGKDVHDMIQSLDYTHIILTFAGVYPWFTPLFKAVAGVFTGDKLLYFQKFASEKIAMARQEHTELAEDGPATTMVTKFLDSQRREPKKGITEWDIAANAGSNIGAGSDTTAIGLIAIVYYLFRDDPAILKRAREEIDRAGLPDRPNFQEAQKLPFLQAVIKESMRLLPGVGLPLWREVPKGGAVVCGQFFPEGTNLGVNAWVSHHNKQVYGEDADLFRPERWLEASGEPAVAMEQSWIPFGLGSRTCIDKNVLLLEIKTILVLVRDFDFYFQDQHGTPETRDYITLKNKWFLKAPHLYARVVRRNLKAG